MPIIAALFCGLIFGWGLLISEMVQPAKVLGFLDVFGAWDPSLAVVMAAALTVSVPGFMLVRRQTRPILTAQTVWPAKTDIDRPLVIGSALFGAGWGLVGLCPGPALENLATLSPRSSSSSRPWLQGWRYAISGSSVGRRSCVKHRPQPPATDDA